MSISKICIPNFVCVLKIKDRRNIEQNFHSVAKVIPRVGLWGAGGVKNFNVGICDDAPSIARSSYFSNYIPYNYLVETSHTIRAQ